MYNIYSSSYYIFSAKLMQLTSIVNILYLQIEIGTTLKRLPSSMEGSLCSDSKDGWLLILVIHVWIIFSLWIYATIIIQLRMIHFNCLYIEQEHTVTIQIWMTYTIMQFCTEKKKCAILAQKCVSNWCLQFWHTYTYVK